MRLVKTCMLITTIAIGRLYQCESSSLYLSSTSGTDNGTCTNKTKPCKTWDYVSLLFDTGDKLYIENGVYSASSNSSISKTSSGASTIDIIGESSESTKIHYISSDSTFISSSYNKTVVLRNFSLLLQYGVDSRLGYFYYDDAVVLDTINVNGIGSDGYGSYDLVYSYATDNFTAKNIIFYDIDNSNIPFHLFEIWYADSIILENMMVINTDGDFYLQNIKINDYYSTYLFSFRDSDYYDIYLTNITLNNVYGATLFWFYGNYYTNTYMDKILADGHGNYLTISLVYYDYNYGIVWSYVSLEITDSKFSNYVFSSSSTSGIYLYRQPAEVIIRNVSFINITAYDSVGSGRGLIYVAHSHKVIIDECTFENNTNFVGLVHCIILSYCKVDIRNSVFNANLIKKDCGNGEQLQANSGVYLENRAYGEVNISNNWFDGNPTIIYDSRSHACCIEAKSYIQQ